MGDGVEPAGPSSRLLPSSVLDRAGTIAHHFSNSIRRSSLSQEDVHLLGCASPRPTSSLRREPVPPQPPETTETDLTVLSAAEESFWDVSGEPGRRRDSMLSKEDQLLISKIKRYYENAGGQSPTLCLQRRESLTFIPAGLVRSSVSRINSIPKADSTETSSWVTAPGPSAAPATEDQDLPNSSESLDTLRLEQRSPDDSGESQRWSHQSSQDEEFLPSSQMIRIWQTMEQKITLAQQENKISKLQEAPQSFRASRFKVCDSMKVQNKDSPPECHDLQRAEEELFVLRAPGHQEDGGEQTKSKVLHLARQYSQKIKSAKPVVRQRSQGLLMGQKPLACVMEELEKMESSGRSSASLLAKVQACSPTFPLCADKPRLELRNQAEPAEDRPTSSPAEEVISTAQLQSSSVAQSSSATEAFDWPDVQHLRSKYSPAGGGGEQQRVLSRARSVPERLCVRRHSSCWCTAPPEGPWLRGPSSESGDSWDADTEEWPRRLERASSLDLRPRRRSMAGAAELLAPLSSGRYFVAAKTPRPDDPEHSAIVLEKVQEPGEPAEEEGEENYVQIRSPTSKEKISLLAVMDRCRAYQDSEEARVRTDGTRSRAESSKQGRVKNLREKFQNMS